MREQLFFGWFFENGSGSTSSTLGFLFSTAQLFPNCFCSHILGKLFEFFLGPVTTYLISGAAISNKSAPILFAAETIYFLLKRVQVSQEFVPELQNLFHVVFRMSFKNREISWILSNPFVWSLNQKGSFEIFRNKKITRMTLTDKNDFFHVYYLLVLSWYYGKSFSTVFSTVYLF